MEPMEETVYLDQVRLVLSIIPWRTKFFRTNGSSARRLFRSSRDRGAATHIRLSVRGTTKEMMCCR